MKTPQIKKILIVFILIAILSIAGCDIAQAVAIPYALGFAGSLAGSIFK